MLDGIKGEAALMKTAVPTAPFFYPPGERFSDILSIASGGCQAIKPGVDLSRMKGKEAMRRADGGAHVSRRHLKIRVEKKGVFP